ncbi:MULTISPECIES: hypothetical protein [Lysinibacillus]|uniref:Uncharacterized protein n=1 Tax=Lysinibacillus fusiformis TaxID=28031 RepID=A0A2I0UVG9_9BACI|nr:MULTISPECIES: hypothetical protein [Lysinibacillus]KUF30801.1 hypothetical protein AK833_16825 [Lysinibacillus sp. F5]MEE3807779.1 hypothetical protein [Lysinibacillus fusiformis]PKU50060.1 hypothetical protein CRI88_19685 [Lysinibacillus fusiformis]SCY53530.1 hypothetical protein SAMN02787078_01745 [Lysinibacillus sp. SG9]SDB23248.1 hypothetical protein SAMN02787079_01746 [Lysinibacillus sp. TC-37]
MGNIYSAQNIASYLIYELNEGHVFVNNQSIQHLLTSVDKKWKRVFGHTAFQEYVVAEEEGYTVKEVFEAYEHYGVSHIALPATELYLKYGTFQLVERTYAIPNFTEEEISLVQQALTHYRYQLLSKAS